jgi:hypothetical protein
MKNNSLILAFILFLTACMPASATSVPVIETGTPTLAPVTNTPRPAALWISRAVPDPLREIALTSGIPLAADEQSATQILDVADSGSSWIYALVAPFATIPDDVTYSDLLSTWKGAPNGPLSGYVLLLADSTLTAFTALWGEPASGVVRSVPSDQLLDMAWGDPSLWAIIPFEEIQPKWKVISVDGQSPLHKSFDENSYKLKVSFAISGDGTFILPETNRDPAKLTTVILTGVTALVRATAQTMELKGVTYPADLIRDTLREADVTHISNEVTFDKDCPPPHAGHRNFILCSNPKYIELLEDVGVDVVEITGDHLLDRGHQALQDTITIYNEKNLPYYGGGENEVDARKPVLMTVNGNKIAFMGCNGKRPGKYTKAGPNSTGPADCDYPFFAKQIQDIKAQGYTVIFTFQHEECYSSGPCWTHEEGFRTVADAGATVVSGSQAHYPHIMEFRGDSFIHYGLGNLFFDQMNYILPDGQVIDETRREFMDRHIFYDGKYLGVELLTSMLEDYARPRPMTEAERTAFLGEYFYASGFIPLAPTLIPQPTATLTPITLPQTPVTQTP